MKYKWHGKEALLSDSAYRRKLFRDGAEVKYLNIVLGKNLKGKLIKVCVSVLLKFINYLFEILV